ncbi:DinB/UmuC family translesion DNA polymerase [Dankookia rubra]|uniref:DinB/UmuC family translesion DNA polymerase n=1 Tax=Dankookia rubra TaxID=1442381 RepID=UPI0019D567B5|nr:hypothetical protein [Dankookia rubra]
MHLVRVNRIRKSVVAENTFPSNHSTLDAASAALQPIIGKVWRYCEDADIRSHTVTLKVKYADFSQVTQSRTGAEPVSSRAELEQVSLTLLKPLFPVPRGIRLLGVTLSALNDKLAEADTQFRLMLQRSAAPPQN